MTELLRAEGRIEEVNFEGEIQSDLSKKTVCLKMHIGVLGNRRKVSTSQIEVDTDKSLLRVSKALLTSKELQAIKRLDTEIRNYVYGICLPFETGVHLLPFPLIEQADKKFSEFQQRRQELIQQFVAAYPNLCREAAKQLRSLYNPNDYPATDSVAAKFSFSWRYVNFGVPGQLREISAEIFKVEREKAARMMTEAASDIQQVMRQGLADLVDHLKDRLQDGESGKPRRLKESTVSNLKEFLDSFDFRNVVDDKELKSLVEKARSLVSNGVTGEAIRNSDSLRTKVRDGMAEISKQLDGMIVEGPRRKFRFEEEEAA
jgi:hypothetical protein